MKHVLFSILSVGITLIPVTKAFASEGRNAVLEQATPHDRLLSITFNGDNGLAVGEGGRLMTSTDGGKSWKEEKVPTDLELMSIATNGKRTIVVGQAGLILIRDNSGQWKKVESGTPERLLQVDLNKNGLAVAAGAFGVLLKSIDGGDSWQSIAPQWAALYKLAPAPAGADGNADDSMSIPVDEPTNYAVKAFDNDNIVVAGEYGAIIRSSDAGTNWSVVYRSPTIRGKVSPTIFGMRIRDDGGGFAVGQSGLALQTADFGKSWTLLPTPVEASLFGVESYADGKVAVVGMRVGLYSQDNGKDWQSMPALDLGLNWYADVAHGASSSPGEFIAVGHGGRIVRLAP